MLRRRTRRRPASIRVLRVRRMLHVAARVVFSLVVMLTGPFVLALGSQSPGWLTFGSPSLAHLSAQGLFSALFTDEQLPLGTLSSAPATAAARLAEMHPGQRFLLEQGAPQNLGNLAGLDIVERDAFNRRWLGLLIDEAAGDDELSITRLPALTAIRDALGARGAPRFLVTLTDDAPPLAAIAVGDPDTADEIAFAVPGMGANTYDMQLWTQAAQNIFDAQGEVGGSIFRSVIAWIGYRTPPQGLDAVYGEYAARGAPRVAQDIIAMQTLRPDAAISVVAHSYGTTTAANAIVRLPEPIHAFVMLGSAGIEEDVVPTASALQADAVYAAESPYDRLASFGRAVRVDPRAASFGATVLDVTGDARRSLRGVTEHTPVIHSDWNDDPTSTRWTRIRDLDARKEQYAAHERRWGYLDRGTQSLRNVGVIVSVSPWTRPDVLR